MRVVYSTILSLCIFGVALAQPDSSVVARPDTSEIKPIRLAGVASLATVSFIGSYYLVLKEGWWDSSGNDFHFENDFEYAKNIDKAGHFFSGVLLAEGFYDGFRWSGVSEFNSYLLAGSMASLTHVGIDVKDGFSPGWGYSVFDVLSGSLGGFYPMAKRYVPAFQYIDYKFSYWVNSTAYWDQPGDHTGVFTDDYCNQTHWLSFKVNKLLPRAVEPYWPDVLAFAAGVSVQDTLFKGGAGVKAAKREVFVGLDWDLEGLVKPKTPFAKRVVRYLNYIKLPAPTLQVYPERKMYWTYPIEW